MPDDLEQGSLVDEDLERGYVLIPWLVLGAQELSRDASLLYGVLKWYAWQERQCFPGYERLCADLRAGSRTSVRRWMAELEKVGLVIQTRRGLGRTNLYRLPPIRTARLTVAPPWSETDHPDIQVSPPRSETDRPDGQRVAANSTQRNTTDRTKQPDEGAQEVWAAILDQLAAAGIQRANLGLLADLPVRLDGETLVIRGGRQWAAYVERAARRPVRFES